MQADAKLSQESASGFAGALTAATPMTEPAPLPPLPESSPTAPRALSRRIREALARAGRFSMLTLRKSGRDGITLHASALAFSTVFAIIPLLAAFLFVGGHVFAAYRPQVIGILRQVLPYTEDRLLEQIGEFLNQAQHLRGVGLGGFVLVSLIAVASVETTVNRIWNVTSARSWGKRIYSFVMLLLWGPLLIGAAYSTLALLRRQTTFDRLWHESPLFMAIPFVVTTFGLTMLYWLVPNTAVRARYALAGGLSAALLLELLRGGFKLYLAFAPGLSVVYGGFALALIFMVSIDAAWTIVLLGCEISYTAQHFKAMSRRRRTIEPLEGGWLGLAVLSLVAEAERAGAPSMAIEDLASRLELPSDTLRLAVAPLVAGRWLKEAGRSAEGLKLGVALDRAKLEELFALYDGRQTMLFATLPPENAGALRRLQDELIACRKAALGEHVVEPAAAPPEMGRNSPSEEPPALDSEAPGR